MLLNTIVPGDAHFYVMFVESRVVGAGGRIKEDVKK